MPKYESYFELDQQQHDAQVGFYKNDKTNGGWHPIMLGACGTKADPRYMATFVNEPGNEWDMLLADGDQALLAQEATMSFTKQMHPTLIAAVGAANDPLFETVYEKTTTKSKIVIADALDEFHKLTGGDRSHAPRGLAVHGEKGWHRIVATVQQQSERYRWSYTIHMSLQEVLDYQKALAVGRVRPILIMPFPDSGLGSDQDPDIQADNIGKGGSFISPGLHFMVVWEDSLLEGGSQVSTIVESLGPPQFTKPLSHLAGLLDRGGGVFNPAEVFKPQLIAAGCMTGLPWLDPLDTGRAPKSFPNYYVRIYAPTHLRKAKAKTKIGLSAHSAFDVLDDVVAKTLDNGARHAALAVVRDGKLYYAKAFTRAEDTYEPVKPTSNFRLASLAKPITSIAIMKLYENGLKNLTPSLELGESVPDALGSLFTPLQGLEIHPDWDKVTIDDLLYFRSGVAAYLNTTSTDVVLCHYKANNAAQPPVPLKRDHHLVFLAGGMPKNGPTPVPNLGKKGYANVEYVLLGGAIANKTKWKYEVAIGELILKPLGITYPQMSGIGPTMAAGDPATQATDEAFYNDEIPQAYQSANHADRRLLIWPYTQNFEMDIGSAFWSMSILDVARILAGLHPPGLILDSSTRLSMWQPSSGDAQTGRGWTVSFTPYLGGGIGADFVKASKAGDDPGTSTKLWYWADDVAAVALSGGKAKLFSGDGLRAILDGLPWDAWAGDGLWGDFGYSKL